MAAIQLHPPEPFTFHKPDEWPRWIKRFDQFRLASGLSDASPQRQVSTLLYCLGQDAEDTLQSMNATAEDRASYDSLRAKFDTFFQVRRNIIFERARFNRRIQQDGESVEQFIVALYSLAENCQYEGMKDEMIRDRLVVGIKDTALSERLQMDADLTLEKAKKQVRQKEAVHEHQHFLREGETKSNPIQVDVVRGKPRQARTPAGRDKAPVCTRCGGSLHKRDSCPAKEATCFKCHNKGHYSSRCFTKSVSAVQATEMSALDDAFLDTVTTDPDLQASWTAEVRVGSKDLMFKLDTGADVTAISDEAYKSLGNAALQKSSKMLYGPGRKALSVSGEFSQKLYCKGKATVQQIFVIKGLTSNLLGLPAISALNLATRVDTVADYDSTVKKAHPKLFQGLGEFGEPYHIKLRPDAKPHALYTPRRVPLPLRSRVKEELHRMETLGVISRVDEPTPWCAGMVPIPKKAGSIRICVDLQKLNESVQREVHPLPRVDETLGHLAGAKLFSKLDANSGFWQIPLAEESRRLTTFITPFGRYYFNKLPFGISSAPENFQKQMSRVLEGLDGVVCQLDDVLVHGPNQDAHDSRLEAVLKRMESAGVTLNPEKCSFSQTQLKFLGHIVNEKGVSADPEKTAAVRGMKAPTNVSELRRFLGMVNQLGKFSHNLAELCQPLRELLSKKRSWLWGSDQDLAFCRVKEELSKPTILALYDPLAETKISSDASSFGLGAVILQKSGTSQWRPVAFASRSLTETERRYAQIEKEALATVWACEKFQDYILGKWVLIETDHKPLVPLLNTKHLDNLPPRILRFRLRLARFSYTMEHVPGKLLYTADALSRAPIATTLDEDRSFQQEMEHWVHTIVQSLPASPQRLKQYCEAQAHDPVCSELMKYCRVGWPAKSHLKPELKPYWETRNRLSLSQDLLLYGSRIVVPCALQKETLEKIHQGHQGIQRCHLRAQNSVWWPGISSQIKETVQLCPTCAEHSLTQYEPMIALPLPDRPWQRLSSDLFELKGTTHLLVVDYYSRYPEVVKLSSLTSGSIATALKSIFSRHGIPETLISDNGPQFDSQEFRDFALSYGFRHITSSPHYPQGNGFAERTVKTVKSALRKAEDPYLALLSYRATPFPWCGLSPTQLLMGRQPRTPLPQADSHLTPQWSFLSSFRQDEKIFREKQRDSYDKRHRVHPQAGLSVGTPVWVRTNTRRCQGSVVSKADTPRSYWVDTPSGKLRRNRRHLTLIPEQAPCSGTPETVTLDRPVSDETISSARSPIMTRTRTNTEIHPPERLRF